MDTVQMNKKIKEIMDSSDFYLLSEDAAKAVSYTHLTLPTNREV